MASTIREEISRLELLHAAHPDGLVFPHLADAYRRAGRFAQAENVLNAGLRRHSDYSSAHVVLGRLRLDQGKREEAERAFRRVLQLDAHNHVALELLARLATEEGRLDEALAHLRRLATLKPSDEVADRIAALELQAAEATHARDGHDPAEVRASGRAPAVVAADVASGAGGNGGGARAPRPAPPDAPDPAVPGLPEPGEVVTETMAELYTRQGLLERAEAVYRQLHDADPDNPRLKRKLEEVRERRGGGAAAMPAAEPDRAGERAGAASPGVDGGTTIQSYLNAVLSWDGAAPDLPAGVGGEPAGPEPKSEPAPAPAPDARGPEPWAEAPVSESPDHEPPDHEPSPARPPAPPEADQAGAQTRALIALTDMLVGLLEYRDPFFRGSSSLTRLLATNVAEEMGLSESDRVDLALAAVLRDLGRLALGGRLIEDKQLSKTPEARRRIERHVDLALTLMEGIQLPPAVTQAVRHHHERWDGAGYPDALAGEAIPLVARVLAVVDSFAAMVSPRPYRLPRKAPDAAREMKEAAGTQFDPAVVDALLRVLERRDQAHLGFVQRHHILLVNPDQPGAVVTAAKLCSAGYLAEVAVDADSARERLRRVPVAALVVSADAGADAGADPGAAAGAQAGADAAEDFVRELRLDPLFASLPIVVVDAESVGLRVRLLESGADVCFPPGISYGELQGTLGALVRRTIRSREPAGEDGGEEAPWLALQGDVQDFPLAWLLQVMKYDSRTAAIGIRTARQQGAIYITDGDAVHAQVRGGPKGEEALKAMLQWRKGRFTVQPDARPRERTIQASIMHLLLTQAVEEDHAAAGVFGAVSDNG